MIYFVTARSVGLVKIGYARRPQERFTAIKSHSPVAIDLERVAEGGQAEEIALHERFAASRQHGEWFLLGEDVEQFMQTLPKHEWRHRGWHHAAHRAEKANAARQTGAAA
jgi:hypothetical protein